MSVEIIRHAETTTYRYALSSGEELLCLDIESLAKQVSDLLETSSYLVQYSPFTIMDYMMKGQSAVITKRRDVIAHTKLELHNSEIVELGSVVVAEQARNQGLAQEVVQAGMDLADRMFPQQMLVAVVARANEPSNTLFREKFGAELFTPEPGSIPVRLQSPKNYYLLRG